MEISKGQKAFTLIELLVSILIFGFVLIATINAFKYISKTSKLNEIRYLMLNRIDSEMSRLVFAHENLSRSKFSELYNNTQGSWDDFFTVGIPISNDKTRAVYSSNPLHNLENPYGLHIKINSGGSVSNILKIYNQGAADILDVGDLVGLLAWKIRYLNSDNAANLSLSITYPYVVTNIDSNLVDVSQNNDFELETINLKTSTLIKSKY